MLDAIILNYNDYLTTKSLVERIKDYKSIDHIIVVDNCSNDGSFEQLKNLKNNKIEIIQTDRNGGYGYGNNFGMKYSRSKYNPDYYIICNPDVEFSNATVGNLINFLDVNTDYGMVAPTVMNNSFIASKTPHWEMPTSLDYALSFGVIISHSVHLKKKNTSDIDGSCQVDILPGSFFAVSAEAIHRCDYYDENQFLYAEEIVLAIKMKKNRYKLGILNNEYYIHHHSVSISKNYNRVKKRKILNKSKYHVLSRYLDARWYELLVAKVLGFISLLEIYAWEIISNLIR